jgi:hypothetical protein
MMNAVEKNTRSQRGAALILVLMLVAVFLILMGSLVDALALESQSSIESADSSAAVTAAYSGVDLMVLSIEEYFANGIQNGQPPQTASCLFNRPGGGTVTTYCTAKIINSWNGNGLNYYLISSQGQAIPSSNQEVDRTVLALVREVPFGAYAHFSESGNSNTGGEIWYTQNQNFAGPVYSGGKIRIMYDASNQPPAIFPMGFTSDQSAGDIKWIDLGDGNHSPPNTQAERAAVFGSSQPTFGSKGISLPGTAQNLDIFSEAYYGDAQHGDTGDLQSAGQQKGVFVNGGDPSCPSGTICTGIFVAGSDVQIQGSSVGSPDLSSGSQTWQIRSPSFPISPVSVTVDFAANTTTVTVGSTTTTYSGVASGEQSGSSQGNGAIFVDGNVIVGDNSTVHGQYTLAVPDPPINSENIVLQGNLTYKNDPTKGPSQDELALWADAIDLTSSEASPTIMAMILTGYSNECTERGCGGYFANSYCKASGCNGGGTGVLTVYGSDIENLRGKMGEVDSSGGRIAGYTRAQSYDPRLGAVPPPFSPTTNLYSIVALQDVGWPGH